MQLHYATVLAFEQYATTAAAWTLSSADGVEWIEGGGIVPGVTSELNSYRAELAGLLGPMLIPPSHCVRTYIIYHNGGCMQ